MRKWFTILFLFFSFTVKAATYYLSPSGNDISGTGAIGAPWFTLNKAWTVIDDNDIVYMRGGTYTYVLQQYLTGVNGTAGNVITIQNYPDESPVITRGVVFNKSAGYFRGMVVMFGDYFHWKGIRFTGMYTDDDVVDNAFIAHTSDNNTFEQLECDDSVAGFYLDGDCTGNLILNCDFHDNYSNYLGTNGSNSDGIALAFNSNGSATNTVTGCRSYWNGDDGFDTFDNEGIVTFNNCWSFKNGFVPRTGTTAGNGVGFKLHITSSTYAAVFHRFLNNCVAAENRWDGYGQEEGDTKMRFYNCDAYANGRNGFILNFGTNNAHELRNNVTYNNGDNQVVLNVNCVESNNSYGGGGENEGWTNDVTNGDFNSVDYTELENARSGGELPTINFLNLAVGSSLIDAGVDVGLPFNGSAPDRGAFEFGEPVGYKPMALYYFKP